jgi:primosomal protein N'
MHYYEVAPNQIVRTDNIAFTYASPSPLAVGQLVIIEVGKKHFTGVIISEAKKPAYATKNIISIIEDPPLPLPLIELAKWLSSYYATHFATVLQTVLPRGLQKTRRVRIVALWESL